MNPKAVLIVPACEEGRGGGHLSRSVFLLNKLLEMGREAFLWIPTIENNELLKKLTGLFTHGMDALDVQSHRILSREDELSGRVWDFFILDRFRTTNDEFRFWQTLSERSGTPLIGIDEGGPCRIHFDFLFDLLPGISKHEPNLSAPGFLPLPKNRRPSGERENHPIRVLISFGAEDSAGLGYAAARALLSQSPELNITLINPRENLEQLPGIMISGKIPALKEKLSEYDLLITHFGLSAFEAVYARIPVLLLSPSAYHEKLAHNAGFLSMGCGARGIRRLKNRKIDRGFLETLRVRGEKITSRYDLEGRSDFGAFINSIDIHSPVNCPICNKKAEKAFPVLCRLPEETYRRCPSCGMIFLSRLKPPPIEYEKDYFFGLYKKQYGKTYLEDFPNLIAMGRKRIIQIMKLLEDSKPHSGGQKPSLLDIGCAYGPFLAVAAEAGFLPNGVEPAEDAVRYIKEELKFTAWHGIFPDALPDEIRSANDKTRRYDAVTLWYVIEHFEGPGKMLNEINKLLKKGGIVAFSTPSCTGISGRKSLKTFLENSPSDHWTIWDPAQCKKIFRHFGFELRKIVVTGHHPERFPVLGRLVNPAKNNLFFRLLLLVSRIFRLGDTFEAYGVKL